MKKISLIITAIALTLCVACNVKGARAEEDAYNPYDTSELENVNSVSDTLYSIDTVIKNFKLQELK
ncbi:hypothetical protein CNR22_14045 [Sphingobacteriaceae bacterium]|nr:hypothetical protein CNR22_14045 [Sphingobacteriaceae bacterium]